MNILYALFSLLLILNSSEKINDKEMIFQTGESQDPKGLILLKKHCYQCHNPNTTSHDEILAPPLFGIKSHYKKAYPESEQFIRTMVDFVKNPMEEKALMKGPIKRFGLMKNPELNQEDIQIIVEYLESNDLEKPVWFEQHKKSGNQ
ncbi:c-type cytochrome [Algoriphagus sp. SE2]|uniref:c-type cytochrome n=1 Tax=Algoriphagus sp. SE2 TaxID=3141536 RepID=UPI0031CD8460